MKKVRRYFWLKSAGLLSILIVFLLGSSSCRHRHMTKYGPPSDYDEPVTKYGVPVDYNEDEFDEINENDTTATIPNEFYYEETLTKYGTPPDYDDPIEVKPIDTTNNPQ